MCVRACIVFDVSVYILSFANYTCQGCLQTVFLCLHSQVLNQSQPQEGRDELLHQILTCDSAPPHTALKRLLRCGKVLSVTLV